MRLFKSEMIFMPSLSRTTRPRYGGRGPRLMRALAEQPVRSASICILNAADPEACVCRTLNAAWPTDCELGQAA
jgi:hypothetical protein